MGKPKGDKKEKRGRVQEKGTKKRHLILDV